MGKLGWGESSAEVLSPLGVPIWELPEVEAAVVATTAVATTEAVAEYTPQTRKRRREHRGSDIGKDGGSSTVRFDLAWRRSCLTTAKSPPGEAWGGGLSLPLLHRCPSPTSEPKWIG